MSFNLKLLHCIISYLKDFYVYVTLGLIMLFNTMSLRL